MIQVVHGSIPQHPGLPSGSGSQSQTHRRSSRPPSESGSQPQTHRRSSSPPSGSGSQPQTQRAVPYHCPISTCDRVGFLSMEDFSNHFRDDHVSIPNFYVPYIYGITRFIPVFAQISITRAAWFIFALTMPAQATLVNVRVVW